MEDTKKCTKCGRMLPLKQFYKRKCRDGSIKLHYACKNCFKVANAKWRADHSKEIREYSAMWRKNNPKYQANYGNRRRLADPDFKIIMNIRNAISQAFRHNYKSDHVEELLGCSIECLRQYLEDRFVEGMTWANYGVRGWHIDHIIPLSYFDFSDPEQQRRAWHYTNLRPLWATDNLKKNNKIIEIQLVLL